MFQNEERKARQIAVLYLILLFVIAFFMSACAMKDGKSINDMTNKEKLVMMYGVYNSQYSDYMRSTGYLLSSEGVWEKSFSVDFTDDQKDILNKKKAILKELYPLINLYDSFVSTGITPSAESEQKIFELLDRIALLVPD